MDSVLWYIFTFGIPILGVAICAAGGTLCYRWARSQHVGHVSAMLGYLVATSLPIGLAVVAIKFGSYLARACCESAGFASLSQTLSKPWSKNARSDKGCDKGCRQSFQFR